MNYIGLLTKEEKSILCGIITGKEFKELFKRNEQEFSKIRKGFRAKSLTEQQALSIAISNVDKPFLAMWVNTMVEHWLEEIQENIAKRLGISANTLFDPEISDTDENIQRFIGKFQSCSPENRQILLSTLDYLAEQLLALQLNTNDK